VHQGYTFDGSSSALEKQSGKRTQNGESVMVKQLVPALRALMRALFVTLVYVWRKKVTMPLGIRKGDPVIIRSQGYVMYGTVLTAADWRSVDGVARATPMSVSSIGYGEVAGYDFPCGLEL